MKMAFIGDSLVSCTNETLANTWYDIASKKMGFDVVNNAAGGKLTLVMWGMFKMGVPVLRHERHPAGRTHELHSGKHFRHPG